MRPDRWPLQRIAVRPPPLAWLANPRLGSFALYLLVYQLLRKRYNKIAVAVVWFEVFAHASFGVVVLGWESGVHTFILLLVPITVARTGCAMLCCRSRRSGFTTSVFIY